MRGTESEWQRGGRVVLAAAAGVGVGIPALVNSAGLFVIPMQQEFGWSRGALAVGPIVGLTYACLNPLGGLVIDRVGARPAVLAGLLALGLLLLALAFAPPQPLIFYALLALLGVTGTVTSNVVYCKATATWFLRHAGTALALVLSGVSLVGAALQPALAWLIEQHGWRAGYLALAAAALLIGLPVVFAWFHESRRGNAPGQTARTGAAPREAMRDRRFWLIIAAFGGAALPIGGFVSQLQPLLVSKGYAPLAAATMVSAFLVATAIGRLCAGFLCDHVSPRAVAATFLGLSAAGAALLVQAGATGFPWPLVLLAIALVGLAQGAEADFMALFALRIFGVRHFSTLFASIVTVGGIGFAVGGILFARAFDRYGNYDAAIIGSAAILFLSAMLAATIRVPPAQEP